MLDVIPFMPVLVTCEPSKRREVVDLSTEPVQTFVSTVPVRMEAFGWCREHQRWELWVQEESAMMRMPQRGPDGAAQQEAADAAMHYAAEAAARADTRYRDLVLEKKETLMGRMARQTQPPSGETVKMNLSNPNKRKT